ncbi:phage tail protein, partial [Lactobacillus mulieris]
EVYIDSENCLVYKSLDQLRNRNAIFPDHNFPILQPGTNSISITGNYSSATITPRWRTLC